MQVGVARCTVIRLPRKRARVLRTAAKATTLVFLDFFSSTAGVTSSGIVVGVFGLDVRRPPNVDFPDRLHGESIAPEGIRNEVGLLCRYPLIGDRGRKLLLLGIEFADRYSKLCPGLEHARAGASQSQVLALRDLYQSREYRIVKYVPPITVLAAAGVHRRIPGLVPLRCDLSCGLMVVRSQHTPADDQPERCGN